MADYRNLLYWNPIIKPGNSKSSNLRFYTSDDSGKYLIVIEGITSKGEKKRIAVPFNVVN
jgi:hypothetical protein